MLTSPFRISDPRNLKLGLAWNIAKLLSRLLWIDGPTEQFVCDNIFVIAAYK